MPVTVKKEISTKELEGLIKKERTGKLKIRYQALLLLRQFNNNAALVGKKIGKHRSTIGRWVKEFNQKGLAGLVYRCSPGRTPRLNKEEQNKLKKIILKKVPLDFGIEYPFWDGKSLSYFIKKLFKVELKIRQCQYLFHKLDLSLQRPRHAFIKADPKKQAAFKREFKKKLKIWMPIKK